MQSHAIHGILPLSVMLVLRLGEVMYAGCVVSSDLMSLAGPDDFPPLGQQAWLSPCGTGTTGCWC